MYPLGVISLSLSMLLGIGASIVCVLAVPLVAVVVIVLLVRRTAGQPAQPPAVDFLNTPVDLGIFNGLFNAIRANDKQKMLIEIEILARRAGEAGGAEAMLEAWCYAQLERKLGNPASRTPVLSALARVLRVTERQLLDTLEGKVVVTPAPAAVVQPVMQPVVSQPIVSQPILPQAAAAAAKLLLLAMVLAAGAQAHAAPPLISPERFEPDEPAAVIDPPTFRTLRAPGLLVPSGADAPVTYAPPQPSYWYPAAYPVAQAATAPARFFGRLFGRCR